MCNASMTAKPTPNISYFLRVKSAMAEMAMEICNSMSQRLGGSVMEAQLCNQQGILFNPVHHAMFIR